MMWNHVITVGNVATASVSVIVIVTVVFGLLFVVSYLRNLWNGQL